MKTSRPVCVSRIKIRRGDLVATRTTMGIVQTIGGHGVWFLAENGTLQHAWLHDLQKVG